MIANQATFPIATMARVLGVSEAGYHAWRKRPPSKKQEADTTLLKRVRTIHASSHETYGAPRVHAELRAGGEKHGRKRIARLMRAAGLVGASRRRRGVTTTRRIARRGRRRIWWIASLQAAGRTSCGLPTSPSCRRRAGFSICRSCWTPGAARSLAGPWPNYIRAELVVNALEMAIGQRRPGDVIHHSDQGSQYTSLAFGNRCREAGVRPSMGSVGDAYDNAMCESFFATLECELLERRRFASQAEAKMACFSFIEGWYNPVRLHSALGYRSPMAYETARETVIAKPT